MLEKFNGSSMHALVIGINDYTKFPLSGAVADAESVKDYLLSYLHVPLDQITMLLNAEASHEGILNAFRELQTKTSIEHGHPILIYFAGHGTTILDHQNPKRTLQCIVPYSPEEKVKPIADCTLGKLLRRIAEGTDSGSAMAGKGDNIVRVSPFTAIVTHH